MVHACDLCAFGTDNQNQPLLLLRQLAAAGKLAHCDLNTPPATKKIRVAHVSGLQVSFKNKTGPGGGHTSKVLRTISRTPLWGRLWPLCDQLNCPSRPRPSVPGPSGGFKIILKLHSKPASVGGYSARLPRQSRRRPGFGSTAVRPFELEGRADSGRRRQRCCGRRPQHRWEPADAHGLQQNGDRLACWENGGGAGARRMSFSVFDKTGFLLSYKK